MEDTTMLRIREEVDSLESRINQYNDDIKAAEMFVLNLQQKKKDEELKLSTLRPFLKPSWTTIKYDETDDSLSKISLESVRDYIVETLTKHGWRKRSGEMVDEFIKWDNSKRDLFHNAMKRLLHEWIIFRVNEPWRKRNFAYQLNINP